MSQSTSAESFPKAGNVEETKSPFYFLETVILDLIQVIHAVILSSMNAQQKNEIVSMVLKENKEAYNMYIDWRRQITKVPPEACLSPLGEKLQQEVITKLDYIDYEGVRKICIDHPNQTKKLSDWLDIVLDRSRYLDLVYDEAKNTLESFCRGEKKQTPVPKRRSVGKTTPQKTEKETLKMVPEKSLGSSEALPEKAINFLLLGETGVGKTTFINSLVNYLQYSFDDILAKRKQPMVLIDTAFNIFSDTNKIIKVVVKADKGYILEKSNEVLIDGESSTQDPITYKYSWIDGGQQKVIRIIDTPGANDTRGAEQDSKNFDLITRHIARIGSIHAVCVIMKPNETKLTPAMKYCLNNLLLRCYHSATRNILFCFTNCRASMWKPAESLATLRKWMEEVRHTKGINIEADKSNIFCFDNDCFRYMLTIKVCPDFKKAAEDEIYAKGWNKNTEEIRRFLERVTSAPSVDFNEFDQMKDLFTSIAPTFVKVLRQFEQMRKDNEDELQKMKGGQKGIVANRQIASKQEELQLLENESKAIVQVCAEFATYFSIYSVFPIINEFEDGLKTMVQTERNQNGNSMVYYALSALECEYNDCVTQAKADIQMSQRAVKDARELLTLVDNLTKLQLCGKLINRSKEIFYENIRQ